MTALDETVPGGAARSFLLRRTQVLRLTAAGSGANASTLLFAADRLSERLCVPDTLKAQMQARVRPPMVLMSDAGRALTSVIGSSLDWHDAISGHSLDVHLSRFGPSDYATDRNGWRQSARAGLLDELAKWDLGRRDLHASVNFFSAVVPADDARGTLAWRPDHSTAGDWVDLRAETDVLVVLSTAPHPLDPAAVWEPASVHLSVRPGAAPGEDDPSRSFRAESARALNETERSVA
jgi:urea carboxylase-associated protein 2